MILVVEGPSAAGKTTWVTAHHPDHAVPERVHPPPSGDPTPYWAEIHATRWSEALAMERDRGLAVVDTDPLKLHYTWCQLVLGHGTRDAWERDLAAHRFLIEAGRLGFADLVLCEIPDPTELRRRKESDPTRRRRNFDRHAAYAEPLRAWYTALDRVSPGRVRWGWPGGPTTRIPARGNRYDPGLLDALVAHLPG